jgi:hypothetical protein
MGPQLDAFQVGDPNAPIANLRSPVDTTRRDRRLANLAIDRGSRVSQG